MIGDLYNAGNVVVGQAAVLINAVNTALPAFSTTFPSITDPFDDTAWAGATPAWTPVGGTDQGWTWASSKTIQDITIEEQSTLVDRLVASQQFTVTGALSEDIASTLALVHNMTSAVTAPAADHPGYTTLTLSDVPTQYAIAVVMANKLGMTRILYIPAATCLDNVSTPLRRAAAKRMYSAQFTSVCQTDLIQVTEVTAAHS